MTIKYDKILGELREQDSGGSGGTGNVVGSGTSVSGNLPLINNTSTTAIVDSGSALINTAKTITIGTDVADWTAAYNYIKKSFTTGTGSQAALTIQLPAGPITIPYLVGGYLLNTPGVSIIGGITAVQGSCSVVGGPGSAILTFASALPTAAVVGGALNFNSGWTQDGLSGTFKITDITGLAVTIDTGTVLLPNDAGSSVKKVLFISSVLNIPATGIGYTTFQIQRVYVPFINVAFFQDNVSRGYNSNIISVSAGGSTNLSNCSFTNCGTGMSVFSGGNASTSGTVAFTICTLGQTAQNTAVIRNTSSTSSRTTFNSCTTNQTCLSGGKIYNGFPSMQGTVTTKQQCIGIGSQIDNADYTAVTMSGIFSVIQGGRINGVTDTNSTSNIPYNSMQLDGGFIGSNDGKKIYTYITSSSLPSSSEIVLYTGAGPADTLTLPTAATNTMEKTIKNASAFSVNVVPFGTQSIDGVTLAVLTILPNQSYTLRSNAAGGWYTI